MKKRTKIIIACLAACVIVVLGIEIFLNVRFRRYCESTENMRTRIDSVSGYETQGWRGNILDRDGNILAESDTAYSVYLDATVCSDVLWSKALPELSAGLAEILSDKTSEEYYMYLLGSRYNRRQYVKICKDVSKRTMDSLNKLPLFNMPAGVGGIIVQTVQKRFHPYGQLALRTIGYVSNNPELKQKVGIEGSFNDVLSGRDGYRIIKKKFVRSPFGRVRRIQKTLKSVEPEKGGDVSLTLDMELQAVADSLLRAGFDKHENLSGACLVLVRTDNGAVQTMVNLIRYSRSETGEYYNVAIGYGYEPGLVIAPATALAAVKCNPSLSLNGMDLQSKEALRTMVQKCEPHAYCDTLKALLDSEPSFKNFELEGLAKLHMLNPDDKNWSSTSLSGIACGNTIMASAVRWLELYTAISRGGQGIALSLTDRPAYTYSLCTKEQADAIAMSLKDASAKLFPAAKYQIAGMSGTSLIALPNRRYVDSRGLRAIQSSYVGFFPADKPVFSIICMAYTKASDDLHSAHETVSQVMREFVGSETVVSKVNLALEQAR